MGQRFSYIFTDRLRLFEPQYPFYDQRENDVRFRLAWLPVSLRPTSGLGKEIEGLVSPVWDEGYRVGCYYLGTDYP